MRDYINNEIPDFEEENSTDNSTPEKPPERCKLTVF